MPAMEMGGAERFLADLITRLDKEKFSPALLLFKNRGPLLAEIVAENIPVFCLAKKTKIDLKNFYQIWRAIKKFKPDIVHTQLGGDIHGRLAAILNRVPLIISTEQNVNPDEGRLMSAIKRLTGLGADYIVAISQAVKADAQQRYAYPEHKLSLIPNGVNINNFFPSKKSDQEKFNPYLNKKFDGPVFGTIGRLSPQKGHSILIKSWKLLKNKEAVCLIAGSGPLADDLQQKITENDLTERIKLVGPVNSSVFLRSLDFFLLPSLWEGQGIVLLEAGLSGLPILASDVDGIKELINDQNGWLAPAGDAKTWAEQIDFLIEQKDQPVLSLKKDKLKELIIESYSLEKIVKSYQDLYFSAWQKVRK